MPSNISQANSVVKLDEVEKLNEGEANTHISNSTNSSTQIEEIDIENSIEPIVTSTLKSIKSIKSASIPEDNTEELNELLKENDKTYGNLLSIIQIQQENKEILEQEIEEKYGSDFEDRIKEYNKKKQIDDDVEKNYQNLYKFSIKDTTSYDNFAKERGFDSFEDMINRYNEIKKTISTFESDIKIAEAQKNCILYQAKIISKYSNADGYISENTTNASIEYWYRGKEQIKYSNNNANPLEKTKAVVNIGKTEKADEKMLNLYDASQIEPTLGETYEYLYDKVSPYEANKYLETMETYINMYAGQYRAQKKYETITSSEGLMAVLTTYGIGTQEGLKNFIEGLKFDVNTNKSALEYEQAFLLLKISQEEEWEQFVYNLGLTTGEIIIPVTIGLASGNEWMAAAAAATSATGNALHDARVSEMSVEDTEELLCSTSIETTLTWVLGGKITKMYGEKFADNIKKMILAESANGGTMGGTSFISNLHQTYLKLINNPSNNYSEEEAEEKAWEQLGGDQALINQVILGAVFGGLLGGGSQYNKAETTTEQAKEMFKNTEIVDEFDTNATLNVYLNNSFNPDIQITALKKVGQVVKGAEAKSDKNINGDTNNNDNQ